MVAHFDHVIVGSSPLMLMLARRLSADGLSVMVLSRKGEKGGAWRSLSLGSDMVAEAACHLIEPIPNVYPLLEQYSGERFVPQVPQPYRSLGVKLQLDYQGPANRALTLSSLLVTAAISLIRNLAGTRDPLMEIKIGKAWAALASLQAYVRGGGQVQVPVSGYAAFVAKLQNAAVAAGVQFEDAELVSVERKGEHLWLDCGSLSFVCHRLEVTASVSFRDDGKRLIPMTGKPAKRTSVFVQIQGDAVRKAFSYITFNGGAPLKRMCLLDVVGSDGSNVFVLIELPAGRLWSECKGSVSDYLVAAGILYADTVIDMMFERVEELAWSYPYTHHRGGNFNQVRYWNSRGNLADGIYRYRHFLSFPKTDQ